MAILGARETCINGKMEKPESTVINNYEPGMAGVPRSGAFLQILYWPTSNAASVRRWAERNLGIGLVDR